MLLCTANSTVLTKYSEQALVEQRRRYRQSVHDRGAGIGPYDESGPAGMRSSAPQAERDVRVPCRSAAPRAIGHRLLAPTAGRCSKVARRSPMSSRSCNCQSSCAVLAAPFKSCAVTVFPFGGDGIPRRTPIITELPSPLIGHGFDFGESPAVGRRTDHRRAGSAAYRGQAAAGTSCGLGDALGAFRDGAAPGFGVHGVAGDVDAQCAEIPVGGFRCQTPGNCVSTGNPPVKYPCWMRFSAACAVYAVWLAAPSGTRLKAPSSSWALCSRSTA